MDAAALISSAQSVMVACDEASKHLDTLSNERIEELLNFVSTLSPVIVNILDTVKRNPSATEQDAAEVIIETGTSILASMDTLQINIMAYLSRE